MTTRGATGARFHCSGESLRIGARSGIIALRITAPDHQKAPVVKKFLISIVAVSSALGMAAWVGAASSIDDQIAERLEPVGSVCVQGEDCASGNVAVASVGTSGGMQAPEDIYNTNCSACHAIGVAGAPKFADAAQWADRVDKGIDVLYQSVINGIAPGMPAKGLCMTCSDDELKAVTDYMVAALEQ